LCKKEKFLKKTYAFLKTQNYSLTKNDFDFIKEVKKKIGVPYGEIVLIPMFI
jgi:hypothetical protein